MLDIIDDYWKNRYETTQSPLLAARHREDDRLKYDVEFIQKLLGENKPTVLDLGSGPCVLANEIAPLCQNIVCVEKQTINWNNAICHNNIAGITEDIVNYRSNIHFDFILIFGVVNHLTPERAEKFYENCLRMMKPTSKLILKSQFAVSEDFYVNTFSHELNARYQSHYRTVETEMNLAKNIFSFEVFDIYPDHLNKYSNSRHLHVVCQIAK